VYLAQYSIDQQSKDKTIQEFSNALIAYPLPGARMVRVVIKSRDLDVAAEVVNRNRDAWAAAPTTEQALGPVDVVCFRPMGAWEWIDEFFEKVWMTASRISSYRRILDEIRYVPTPAAEGLEANLANLSMHFTRVQDYLKLCQVHDEFGYMDALKKTFREDAQLHEKIVNCKDWETACEKIKGKIESRYICGVRKAVEVQLESLNTGIGERKEDNRDQRREGGRSMMKRRTYEREFVRRESGRKRDEGRRVTGRRSPRRERSPRRRERSPSRHRRSPPRGYGRGERRDGPPAVCYWCARPGHSIQYCRDKKDGKKSRIPPKQEGMSWVEHVKDVVARRAYI
jgi:hypothetical protein